MESFFTERQVQVIKLREKGLTHEEIADKFGTTKPNIYILEKKAKNNLEKARNTIKIWKEIKSVLEYDLEKGADAFEVPKKIYKKADQKDIKVETSSTEIVQFLRDEEVVNGRKVSENNKILVLEDGTIELAKHLNET